MAPITFTLILKLIHVLAGFVLVGGTVGRIFALQRAKKATDIHVVAELLQLSTFFTTKIVSPIGGLTVLFGLIAAAVGGFPILGFLQGGKENWVLASLVLYIILMVFVFAVSVPKGKALGKAVGAAVGQGKITDELTAALNDSTFNTAAVIQDVLLTLIIILMILKPF